MSLVNGAAFSWLPEEMNNEQFPSYLIRRSDAAGEDPRFGPGISFLSETGEDSARRNQQFGPPS